MAQCIYPITIGQQDGMKKYRVVPCGKCSNCRRRRQAAWSFRLMVEMQQSTSAAFLTFTYDNEHLTWGNTRPTLVKKDLQDYFKRLRKKQEKLTEDKIKYYACGEYGTETQRPHYHAIMFNIHPSLLFDGIQSDIWQKGIVQVDPSNIKTIEYTTKYIMKSSYRPSDELQREFSLMSKGLGKSYLTPQMKNYYQDNLIPYITWKDGQKITMPRYFKEKIFTEEQQRRFGREALALLEPQELDSTKIFEIEQENLKLQKLQNEKRKNI